MDAWQAGSHAVVELAGRAPEWAVAAALILATLGIVVSSLVAIGMAARRLLGMGATPEEVAALLDRKVNGGIERLEDTIAAFRGELDHQRHLLERRQNENQDRLGRIEDRLDGLETLNFMARTGRKR